MTKEDKQLLLKDLCARLAFGRVKCQVKVLSFNEEMDEHIELLDDEIVFIEPGIYNAYLYNEGTDVDISDIKPYLRPMSSMTEEELKEFYMVEGMDTKPIIWNKPQYDWHFTTNGIDYLLSHHFDFRGLIPMGLALEAPKVIYK